MISIVLSEAQKYAKQQKCEREKRIKRAQEQDERLREQVREQKLQQWFQRKQMQQAQQLEELRLKQEEAVVQPTDPQDSVKNYNAWLAKKQLYEKALREKQRKDYELEAEYQRLRKEAAQQRYGKWLETARDKPKPVPMNRGLSSNFDFFFLRFSVINSCICVHARFTRNCVQYLY